MAAGIDVTKQPPEPETRNQKQKQEASRPNNCERNKMLFVAETKKDTRRSTTRRENESLLIEDNITYEQQVSKIPKTA
jgi:hypothetical protein